MTARRDDDVLQPVYSVTSRLRWILLLHALVVNQQRLDEVAHPAALVLACVVMLGWTAVAGRLQSRQSTRTTRLLLADLLVTMALVASSRWILGRAMLVESYVSVPVYWMAASPLVIAVWRGGRWGLGSAALISLLKFVQEPRPDSRVWDSMLLVGLCAWGLGAIVDTLRDSLDERDQEQTRVAALAERDRLNRIIHDGALQVLAMVEREGPELGPRGVHLAELASRQETVLRNQLQDRDVALPERAGPARAPGEVDGVDVARLLQGHASDRVTVSVVSDDLAISAERARELEAAVAEALANVGKHAGDEARAWILLEEEAGELLISVRDNGVGMTREQVERALSGDRLGIQDSILGRVSEIGGVAVARSQPGRGVEWEFRIPMEDV